MKIVFYRWFIGILLFFFCQSVLALEVTKKFIVVSDIHFSPFLGCETLPRPCVIVSQLRESSSLEWQKIFEKYVNNDVTYPSHDTGYSLLKSTFTELQARSQQENPQFVLVPGDFLAHDFIQQYQEYSGDKTVDGSRRFIKKTLEFLTLQIKQTFLNIDVYPAIGNNDSYTGDYSVVPQGRFFQDTMEMWAPLIYEKNNKENFRKDFPNAGYYAINMPNKNQRIIILNTVLFSDKNQNKKVKKAAMQEFDWLKSQLESAKQQHQAVLLTFHIPVGIDIYVTVKSLFVITEEFWSSIYRDQFEQLLKQYATLIVGILPGHIHMDAFQLIAIAKGNYIPVVFTPSISPIFGNNPGYKVFTYDDKTFYLKNFDTYYYPLDSTTNWVWKKEYSFNHIYQPDCQECYLINGMQQLRRYNNVSFYYKKYYATATDTQPITKNNDWIPYYWCDIYNINPGDYKACLRS